VTWLTENDRTFSSLLILHDQVTAWKNTYKSPEKLDA